MLGVVFCVFKYRTRLDSSSLIWSFVQRYFNASIQSVDTILPTFVFVYIIIIIITIEQIKPGTRKQAE